MIFPSAAALIQQCGLLHSLLTAVSLIGSSPFFVQFATILFQSPDLTYEETQASGHAPPPSPFYCSKPHLDPENLTPAPIMEFVFHGDALYPCDLLAVS